MCTGKGERPSQAGLAGTALPLLVCDCRFAQLEYGRGSGWALLEGRPAPRGCEGHTDSVTAPPPPRPRSQRLYTAFAFPAVCGTHVPCLNMLMTLPLYTALPLSWPRVYVNEAPVLAPSSGVCM